MNKKQLIFGVGIVIGLIAIYYVYHYFQRQNISNQENVVIQSMTPCSENSDCTSGNCYGGYCQPCKGVGGQCTSNGNCCLSECDTQVGTCGVGVLTVGAAAVAAGGASSGYKAITDLSSGDEIPLDTTITYKPGTTIKKFQRYLSGDETSWETPVSEYSGDAGEFEEDAQLAEEGTEVAEM